MEKVILVINAGSSSLKFSVFELQDTGEMRVRAVGQVEGLGTAPRLKAKDGKGQSIADECWPNSQVANHAQALQEIATLLRSRFAGQVLAGVGHRVVHGGPDYSAPLLVTPEAMDALAAFVPLAPLHQPHNLAAIRAVQAVQPELPQVACFDTAFHRTQDMVGQLYGLPYEYYERGIRRYGFHGLSYEYIAATLPTIAPEIASGRVVVAHLGSGASMCALLNGRSVGSSMGFTALDGLMMGTRPGNMDPGIVLYLLQQDGLSAKEIEDLLYKRSGLLGLSGIGNDMRVLLASDAPRASLAIDHFIYRIKRELGALAAVLGGLDALVFTAGIGENSARIRQLVCEQAQWLGIDLDLAANEQGSARISSAGSRVSAWVVPTNEELMIARHTCKLLAL
ncbi:MAG TPA: acetate kinase [Accumulibacter sp.]|uniref:Acetate kinase n=2 Tax=Candidatus Accumulibacter TaxID=327159 RepID=A0A080MBE1_9PROT|nr:MULTISPECIES: acetate kinase [Candidatus Accumulibacter]KFB77755.1 MAG: Acetate kinase [Candidatus Accumulibacter cognatus]MBN8518880.1 acetate kinase [Accumulibacter sp.]MBO3711572.1 acetate kinase [Accumulibacter sp.]MCC2866227.1 acetate kinase [Candidatus Accumulibacter phosphatis]MCM8578143.1 acetate kinase [Accumulibacter sp.]